LKNRLTEYAKGQVRSTKDRLPVKLIHYDIADAKAREIFLKSGFGRNQLKKSFKENISQFDYQP